MDVWLHTQEVSQKGLEVAKSAPELCFLPLTHYKDASPEGEGSCFVQEEKLSSILCWA